MESHSELLRKAVAAEKQDIRETFEQQLKQSPAEQRKLGILLFPLTILSQETQGSQTVVQFRTSFAINDAWFRKGCSIRCRQENWTGDGRLLELDDHAGMFSLSDDDVPNLRDEPVTLQFVPDDKTLSCMELACRLLDEHPQLQLFQRFLSEDHPLTETPAELIGLNDRQQIAAAAILGKQAVVLIQGPPGTGKTHTLATTIEQLTKNGQRVIISAPSNTAVDNLCHALIRRNIALLRVGNEEKMSDTVQPYTIDGYLERGSEKRLLEHLRKSLRKADDIAGKHIRNYTKEAATERQEARKERTALRKEIRKVQQDARQHLLGTIPVIAGTPVGLFNELSKDFQADIVIMDEAGQCLEPLAWLTASFGKKLVLCGDPQQLPPVVFSQRAAKLGLGRSLLETAMADDNTVVLNEQYRMAPEIVASINPFFYHDQLRTFFKERQGELRFVDMAGYGEGEMRDESTGSTFHPDEVQLVRTLTESLQLDPQKTVVLSPYNAQLGLLKLALPAFRISTIDAIQGQEEETVVISLTRSNPDQEIGFLKDYRRTNVAITRAKTRCILVGDSATLAGDPFYLELIDFIEKNGIYQSAWEYAS
jgi:ATP-dependent RNA/DNA helicase IGHMBP2